MENFINNIKNVVSIDILIYIIIALIALIILTIVIMALRKKKARKMLEDMELRYNTLKGVPLAFKLNKAVALSRVNEMIAEAVDSCKSAFDIVQEKLKDCSVQLAEIDDLIYVHKSKKARNKMQELEEDLKVCEENVNKINETLDGILEQENEQRVHINRLKEKFRSLKKKIADNKTSYNQSNEYLDKEIVRIEKMFSSFEEWMFASEFNKAADQQKEIGDAIKALEELTDVLPSMYERAKGVLPRAIDEVGYNYAQARNKGIYLEHLEVKRNLEVISDMLKNDLNKLRNGDPQGVHEDLNDCEKRIVQLQEQISKEEKAFEEVSSNIDILYDSIRTINQDVEDIEKLYGKVYERFGFENWTLRLKETSEKLAALNDMKRSVDRIMSEHSVPYSTLLISYRELEQSTAVFAGEVVEMKTKLNNACSDEERAKKQLVKLQLIVNEIQVKMRKHRLPSVSQKYEEDLHKAERMIKDIKVILDNSPLDVKELNKELKVAIDYIYTLYNSVNNLVGMAIMVENTIVFGNRYRSTYPEIDSELTRAELCFRNGQYTKALKIGIQCIEKMHPGAYEKLINKDDTSLLRQEA
ncbi:MULTISPECIES: septation ring formation regulator EzrA [Bacillota]|jgi:septation ring formation regulator|uniref:Septation ring formation regulator EzrA n=2 Tax=Amedibacillus TaxID=2749846 RepID=A0A7G9GLL5_9FIRM|nr:MULTISPECIES: septation ring formation regulator EzrA [Bacillota]QNM11697.1 septation ring formation regulator EzrA [[Eubacterium] hominis]MCH4285054.1 septation ring formation regulator EzrA [Amedibacillus hominis]RGB70332.1 septation ring formation regulator EzrA [Absiella sp. AM09-45]RGC45961.1 septation ring formation regulator EzrA [Absiella sp. AM29-15]RHU09543.1 septation ring formation regulator EzrA [Absiella sp. AM27-20]